MTVNCLESNTTISMQQHPDALFDCEYENIEFNPADYLSLSGILNISNQAENGLVLKNSDGSGMRIDACAEGLIRIRALPDKTDFKESTTEKLNLIKKDWVGTEYKVENEGGNCLFTTDDFSFSIDPVSKDFKIFGEDGDSIIQSVNGGVRFSHEEPFSGGNRMLCEFALDADEHFFGFGGRVSHPDRTGQSVDIFSVKVGLRYGDYGGFPVPFFMSNKGYGIFLNNPWPHVYFDMGKTYSDRWFVNTPGGECDFFIIKGPEFSQIIERFTTITGRVPIPEKWWFGLWYSTLMFENADQVIETAEFMRKEGWPGDVIVLDGPWRGGPDFIPHYQKYHEYMNNDMDWHPDFGNGVELNKSLSDMNFKLALHLNSRNYKRETYQAKLDEGLLRQHGDEVVVNLTNEKSEVYFEELITPRIEEGVAMWWTDHTDRVSGEIQPGIPSRNLFGPLWNRLIHDIMVKHDHNVHLSLSRGGGIGGQQYALPWPGDTACGIERFEEDIWFCLNAGLAGYAFTSVDMGGFTTSSSELTEAEVYEEAFGEDNILRRLCQSIFFVPSPRIHNSFSSKPKFPWHCKAEIAELYKEFIKLRYRYTPYIFSYALFSAETGIPILRPLVYHNRNDVDAYKIGDEFMLGDWMLVAPITEKQAIKRSVYLPEGDWIHLWSGARYTGPVRIEIDAPMYDLSGLPIFIKSGAIIATQTETDYLTEGVPEELHLDIYADADSSSVDLRESASIVNQFAYQRQTGAIALELHNNTEFGRKYKLQVHTESNIKCVSDKDKEVPFTISDSGKLLIEIEISALSEMNLVLEIEPARKGAF